MQANSSQVLTAIYVQVLGSAPNDCDSSTLLDASGSGLGMEWFSKNFSTGNSVILGASFLYNLVARAQRIKITCTDGNGATAGTCLAQTPTTQLFPYS